ncbi:MAG: tetratricopeptide repeat protein [Bacteroidaceae bacterium]|nr:tetratricopeptide repeat protein [Bacteroidaceae bacterium]
MEHTRILARLDELLGKNDYEGAEKLLLYWYKDACDSGDKRLQLLMLNESVGLYRKLNQESNCLQAVRNALQLIEDMGIANNIGAGTTYLNCATAHQAFGRPEVALPLFEKALNVYEAGLPATDQRRGGLYNNMALTLVELKRYEDAYQYYERAITIMSEQNLWLEVAITYLNIASAKEAELGLVAAEFEIDALLDKATELLDNHGDEFPCGYYAFVCEKCASVFGYFGRFMYKNTLLERARDIYDRA